MINSEIIKSIASILQCTLIEDVYRSKLIFPWGGSLFFEESQGRIYINGSFPFADGNHWGPSPNPYKISVSETKSPIQIARDIEKRLLVEYRIAYLEWLRKMQEYEAKEAEKMPLAQRLSDILGAKISKDDPKKFYSFDPVDVHGRICFDAVELKITCSPEMAERICREVVHPGRQLDLPPVAESKVKQFSEARRLDEA